MPASLITLNTTVPAPDQGGTPCLAVFDNGDWEIMLARDVAYLEESHSGFSGSELVANILTFLSLEYDGEEMDVNGDVVHLFVSITIDEGGLEEPVILVWDDGEMDVCERYHAEKLVEREDSGVFNFVRFPEFMDDLRRFLVHNQETMFADDEEDSLSGYLEEDDD